MKEINNSQPLAQRPGAAPGALLPYVKIGLRTVRYDRRMLARFIAGTIANDNLMPLPPPEAGDLIDECQTAAILKLSVTTLRNWRAQQSAAAKEAA